MKKSNFDALVHQRLIAQDFAQPKLNFLQRAWRKLCVLKTV
ncbi:hypothetical protein [Acinetobacter radioresistens]|jgi:hypothetical protein|uniref:Uncharacterized protein n=1 Tax=Acinetobacter radioresistens SK82 TaxID=596318 RepID=A0ABP2GIA1_ACIRA|nr:hypothetical protein [Acinetobacter radioresistens]EET81323.1 hypothetical protein ACIRA0001_0104 [Acinetobacter radioresistens SK82]ENV87153.1 hypothetical protein F940_01126 [Acinetobacter radioresistens NIPH 2130]MCX0341135.1 hypothetical protein [Acinetobacter radioresistens]